MNAPTTQDIETWSRVDFAALEVDDDGLTVLLDRAIEYVVQVTGRALADMPSGLEKTAEEAIQRRVEQLTFKGSEDQVETASDFDLIQSFSAGSYNETRRSMEEMHKSRMVNPWPLLHDLLWRLMTDDKKDEWYAIWGDPNPAFEMTEVDWHWPGYPAGLFDPGA